MNTGKTLFAQLMDFLPHIKLGSDTIYYIRLNSDYNRSCRPSTRQESNHEIFNSSQANQLSQEPRS